MGIRVRDWDAASRLWVRRPDRSMVSTGAFGSKATVEGGVELAGQVTVEYDTSSFLVCWRYSWNIDFDARKLR